MKKIIALALCAILAFSGCGNMSNLTKDSLIGGGSGAAIGAAVGGLIGHSGTAAAIGAAIGTAVGTGVGAIIGKKMDDKAAELAKLEDVAVETVTDTNGLQAIKVTLSSGVLFDFNKSTLSEESKINLAKFSNTLEDLPDTDITIYGHTDNVGSAEANQKVSTKRAEAVAKYLQSCGIDAKRMIVEGKSYNEPVASNETEAGRAQNRRVEIFITADENMIKKAEEGTL